MKLLLAFTAAVCLASCVAMMGASARGACGGRDQRVWTLTTAPANASALRDAANHDPVWRDEGAQTHECWFKRPGQVMLCRADNSVLSSACYGSSWQFADGDSNIVNKDGSMCLH